MSDATKFTKDQEDAITAFMDFMFDPKEKFFVIQGAAGTGKSFLLKHLAETYTAKEKIYRMMSNKIGANITGVYFAASTNKAVAVLADFLRGASIMLPAKPMIFSNERDPNDVQFPCKPETLHKLLGLKIMNNLKTGKAETVATNNPVYYSSALIFIDEASFIDQELFDLLKKGTSSNCKIVLIGDYYQLAPVGETKTIMESLKCRRTVMTEVVRNGGAILKTSHKFRKTVSSGVFHNIEFDPKEILHVNGADFRKMVNDHFKVPGWDPNKAKILAWTNARVQEYNKYVRTLNNLPALVAKGETVMTNSNIVTPNRVFQIDSTVTIRDIDPNPVTDLGVEGRMLKIDKDFWAFMPNDFNDMRRVLKELAREKDWSAYFGVKENWLDLRSAYASSVHKAQGSTYEKVFIDLGDIGRNWEPEAVARLLYVAISRGAKQVICNGSLPRRYCG